MNITQFVLSFLNKLGERMSTKLYDIDGVEICDTDYKVGHEPPKEGWRAYDAITPLTGDDTHFWFRANFKTPSAKKNEYFILSATTGKEGTWDLTNPQGLVYLNGKMVHALDYGHREVPLDEATDYSLYNYFNMGMYKGGKLYLKMSVKAVNSEVEKLYYDIKVPYDACLLLDENDGDRLHMMSVLADAARMVDLREGIGERFYETVSDALAFMESEFYSKLCTTEGKPTVHCIGSTHIDVEWLWARDQTREKIQRSFSNIKSLMDRYPEFNFTLSQPELYRYLKEEAPEKYEELRKLVKSGRWEPEGAMYLEPDCNLTSGESLVRQLIYGKRFFREEFGVESKVLYLPDVFGYSAALPQILKKSGVDYFVTSKISWNDTNTMPMDMFYWEGIDGTEIFTSFITAQPFGGIARSGGKNLTTYNSDITASYVKGTWDRFSNKEYTNRIFMTFGYGDGGGGPTKAMLETARRCAKGIPTLPVTKTDKLLPYLKCAKDEFDKSIERTNRKPRWVGELYLEFHRGTYTSIAKVKKSNRFSENLLAAAEAVSALSGSYGSEFDRDGMRNAWRRVLHNQFHDILPGSSIKKVYDFTDGDYKEIKEYGESVINAQLSDIAKKISTAGGHLVFNPTGVSRYAVVNDGGYVETDVKVPSFGYTVVRNCDAVSKVKITDLTVENEYYTLTLDSKGRIASLFDKRVGRSVLNGLGNVLTAYEDYPIEYDAWELADYYKLKPYELADDAVITPIYDGTRAGFTIERKYMNSVIRQTLWLYSKSPRIDFDTYVDWHERHQILKADFPLNVHATSASYDVQYGHVTRPTHQNTSWDRAKFEIYAHKWADISEYGYGAALMSDSKYGYSVSGSKLSLTLLKCATDPNPEADQGEHRFTYSLLPHVGGFREGGVIDESIALNQPMYALEIESGSGELPETYSFVSLDKSSSVITAVKPAEEGDALIVRFYDAFDTKTDVSLSIPSMYKKAYLADLMENEIEPLEIKDGKVTLPVSNFEIITVKLFK